MEGTDSDKPGTRTLSPALALDHCWETRSASWPGGVPDKQNKRSRLIIKPHPWQVRSSASWGHNHLLRIRIPNASGLVDWWTVYAASPGREKQKRNGRG